MSDSPEQPRRRGFWQLLLLVFLGLVLLDFLLWLAPNLISKHRLTRYERQRGGAGEHFNFADFVPKSVPDESNFALVSVVAGSYEGKLDKNGKVVTPQNQNIVNRLDLPIYYGKLRAQSWDGGTWALGKATDLTALQNYYRSLAGKANAFPVGARPQSPAVEVLLALSKYDKNIEDLRQAARLPDSRFPLNYDCQPPAGILLPHLKSLKSCSMVLGLRAIAELQNGQSDIALADVKLIMRLMAAVRDEPFLVSQLIRIDMLKLAFQPVWEGTQQHRWSDSQLKELDRELAGLDFLTDYGFSVRAESALQIALIEYVRRTREVATFFDNGDDKLSATEIELRFAPDFVYYRNELELVRACQEWMLPLADVKQHSVSLEAVQAAETRIDAMRANSTLDDVLAAMALPAYAASLERLSYAQSSVDMARVAIALERYRLTNGKYPESLTSLAPAYIENVPSDVIGAQPLKYHRTGDGRYVLYSVGWNGTDDGGEVFFQDAAKTLIDYDQGDWVWAGQVIGP